MIKGSLNSIVSTKHYYGVRSDLSMSLTLIRLVPWVVSDVGKFFEVQEVSYYTDTNRRGHLYPNLVFERTSDDRRTIHLTMNHTTRVTKTHLCKNGDSMEGNFYLDKSDLSFFRVEYNKWWEILFLYFEKSKSKIFETPFFFRFMFLLYIFIKFFYLILNMGFVRLLNSRVKGANICSVFVWTIVKLHGQLLQSDTLREP